MDPSTKHSLYDTQTFHTAGEAIMSFQPINAIHQHLCAFHAYADDRKRQIEAHHFCHHYSKDLHQCVIYDSDEANARLIGIEYIVPEHIFQNFDEGEKRYWHSHKYEVESGLLVLQTKTGVPIKDAVNDAAEQPAMLELQTTYGKTIHTWQPDIHPTVPLGPPTLMGSFTAPNQVNPSLVKARDEKLGISTEAKSELRKGYLPNFGEEGKVLDGCDEAVRKGTSLQFVAEERQVKS